MSVVAQRQSEDWSVFVALYRERVAPDGWAKITRQEFAHALGRRYRDAVVPILGRWLREGRLLRAQRGRRNAYVYRVLSPA